MRRSSGRRQRLLEIAWTHSTEAGVGGAKYCKSLKRGEDVGLCLALGGMALEMHQLAFQATEGILSYSIVIGNHTLVDTGGEPFLVSSNGVLNALVAVKD